MTAPVKVFLFALLVLLPSRAEGQRNACSDSTTAGIRPDQNLYCIRLLPTGLAEEASGTAALEWSPNPYSISANRDGTMQYAVTFELEGLPKPASSRGAFVAWAAPPTMSPMIRLGTVRNGRSTVGPVALDRFLIVISNEPDSLSKARKGKLILRGESASNRLRPPEMFQIALGGLRTGGDTAMMTMEGHQHQMAGPDSLGWTTVPMAKEFAMLPSEMALRPGEKAWLPHDDGAPMARPRQVIVVKDGDTLDLEAGVVRKTIAGRSYTMFGFNGQLPGPLLRVAQGTTVVVRFHNRLPLPSTIHWHGVRLGSQFDGVPDLAQPEVAPGDSFTYHLRFPDAGLFWYHPHVREDIQQDLGLYGNIFVPPPASAGWPVAREEFLLLDDLLVNADGIVPYGEKSATHAAMGRFGNLFLVNGERDWTLKVEAGELVRLFLTNAANARVFNLGIAPDVSMELRGADLGRYPVPLPVDHVVLGPAERFTLDVRFPKPGRYALVNRIKALDHLYGRFVAVVDTLGWVEVGERGTGNGERVIPSAAREAGPADTAMANEVARYLKRADSAERRELELTVAFTGLPWVSERLMKLDSIFFAPVEWAGTMPMMNWATTGSQAHWTIRDPATGRTNHAIDWHFPRGTLLRLTLTGSRDVLHAMQHPIHLHGQRFLVLSVGGVPNPHPIWKDTVIVPAGGTVELLVDLSNPGPWMLHCHIAEHLEAGMMSTIVVQ